MSVGITLTLHINQEVKGCKESQCVKIEYVSTLQTINSIHGCLLDD